MASLESAFPQARTRKDTVNLSAQEKQVYSQLWSVAVNGNDGFITGEDAVPFFKKSGLTPHTLGVIWLLVDTEKRGYLDQQEFNVALRLIAHAMNGESPSLDLIHKDAPLPHFEGITISLAASEPILPDKDRAKYTSMFLACDPIDGLLKGDKGREVLLKSRLPVETLSHIWTLADTKQRGSLDLTDFIIAMYYVQRLMDGQLNALPKTLPPSVYEACKGAKLETISPVTFSTPPELQHTNALLGIKSHFENHQPTGKGNEKPKTRQSTGGLDAPWEITAKDIETGSRFFFTLDSDHDGFVSGEEVYRLFAKSGLPDNIIMKVLDLCDITKRGSLDKDEFTLGLELIRRKISNPDMLIPEALPLSMIPPSLRHHVHLKPAHSGSGFLPLIDNYAPVGKEEKLEQKSKIDSEALASIARIKQFLKPDTSEFGDMWKLPPPISPPQTKKEPTDTQVSIGLNGDLRTKSAIPKQDPLNSLKSQLQREGKAVEDLKMERLHLESETSHAQETRAMMEQRLSNLKDQQKRESKAAQDLKTTLATMESELSTLRSAIAVSKRELEIAQADKTAFLNALKNGQEESLELKATLQRSQDEVFKLRTHLEARIRILGLDPLDYPGTGTGEIVRAASVVGGGVGRAPVEMSQNTRNVREPQSVMENLLVIPQKRNPQLREPEPERPIQGPQDYGVSQDEVLSKPVQSQPWYFLAKQEPLAREQ